MKIIEPKVELWKQGNDTNGRFVGNLGLSKKLWEKVY